MTVHEEGKRQPHDSGKAAYEAPRIVWEEDYKPMAFAAVSCARQPGNPACISGPTST
ncbi:MAG TPA: hypothetical protein VMR65_03440 [Candidatus Sulfotelmatobacter sp.]|nr:hypothetical protein [Candidatus Sulfotelmatobacter sp.]